MDLDGPSDGLICGNHGDLPDLTTIFDNIRDKIKFKSLSYTGLN